jgi:hypothetical protein
MLRQLYEDKIGGLELGDVFVEDGEYLSLNLNSTGGLEKSTGTLRIKIKADGGLTTSSSGALIKLKPYGGLNTDVNGIFIETSFIKGYSEGMEVTIKDADEFYIFGGALEINGSLYTVLTQITGSTGTLIADTLYYLYVNPPATGNTLTAACFSLSTTGRTYDHAKGAYYKSDDGTKRWLANVHTA